MKQAFKKLGLLLTLLTAVLFITGCPGPNTSSGGNVQEYTVSIIVYKGTSGDIETKSYKVEKGDTLASVSGLKDPTLEGFDFVGYFKVDGTPFAKNTPITDNLVLFTKFQKVVSEPPVGKTTTTTTTTKSTEQITVTKTEKVTENDDKTTTAEVEIDTHNDKTDKPISNETSKTVTDENEEIVSATSEKTEFNEEGQKESVVATETITSVDDEGNKVTSTTTTTTNVDSQGKETTSTVEETVTYVEDENGNTQVITEKTTTDANGVETTETYSDVQVAADSTVRNLIDQGIEAAAQGRIVAAKTFFTAAYEKDPTNDEAKVYSALADLTGIATNAKMQTFFKDHLGVTNYPSSLNALLSGGWLQEASYELQEEDEFGGYVLTPVENPSTNGKYYFSVKVVGGTDDIEYDENLDEIKPENSIRISRWDLATDWNKLTYKGKDYWVDSRTKEKVEENLAGVTVNAFENIGFGFSVEIHSSSNDGNKYRYLYVIPDDNGADWAQIPLGEVGDATPYESNWGYIRYTYPKTVRAPKFKNLKNENWFKIEVNNAQALSMLVLANVLNGNSDGLNDAVDDLYSTLFESDEYNSAITKINSIKNAVELPAAVVQGMELNEMLGEGETFKIGAPELKLIKSALDVLKGTFEFIQSYNLNIDLSLLKMDWRELMPAVAEEPPVQWILDNFGAYNASIDPIANNLLGARGNGVGTAKMNQAKATFIGVIDDVIAAYDDIVAEDSIYPAAISGMLGEYAILKDTALKLKAAIKDGGLFGIPNGLPRDATEWPVPANMNGVTSGAYEFIIDFGKIFTPGYFSITNMFETTKSGGRTVPVIYKAGTTQKITTAAELKAILEAVAEAEYDGDGGSDDVVIATMPFNFRSKVLNAMLSYGILDELSDTPAAVELNSLSALFIFNFYYGGFEEEVEAFLGSAFESEE